ncbi:MAG: MBL fold metallo-hydrolase [Coriobacteriia bacterium]|nr:MBL fold metallo-hydrolase [Coriobacteriia bacterium]
MTSHTFTFMGTGAGCGVPAFFCDCKACEEARHNPKARRGDCSVMITGSKKVLIDTPPDLRHYLIRENVRSIDRLLYTHAHYDHLGGLGELEYMSRLYTKEHISTYASNRALSTINHEFHYLKDILDEHELEPYASFTYDDVNYTALPVQHAPGTYGYLIETPATRLFYACDTGKLPDETAKLVKDCDILILDGTYWERSWSPETHNSIQGAIEQAFKLNAKKFYPTHLAMHYDTAISLAELEAYVAQYEGRVEIPYDGLSIAI